MHTHNSRAYTLHHFWKIIVGSEDENTKVYPGFLITDVGWIDMMPALM